MNHSSQDSWQSRYHDFGSVKNLLKLTIAEFRCDSPAVSENNKTNVFKKLKFIFLMPIRILNSFITWIFEIFIIWNFGNLVCTLRSILDGHSMWSLLTSCVKYSQRLMNYRTNPQTTEYVDTKSFFLRIRIDFHLIKPIFSKL